jgi:copper chaperone CopZ
VVTAFKGKEGVTEVTVDRKANTATVTFDPAKVQETDLPKALEGTRFKVAGN